MAAERQPAMHHQIHAPTGVTHSVCAYFTKRPPETGHTSLPNLIVIRSTLLEIYEVRGSILEWIDGYRLNGAVESLAVLKNNSKEQQKDAILLTYREAKAAVLEWKESDNSIAASSLHCFEDDLHDKEGSVVFPLGPDAKTDPLGRCACVLFFRNLLALLPARDIEHLDMAQEDLKTASECSAASVGGSCVLHLHTLGIQDKIPTDHIFLPLMAQTVITATWAALYREKKDTRCLTAISLNLRQKIYPVIWSVKHLPSDAYRLIPVPHGGALVLSLNFITFYNQSQTLSVGVNGQAFPVEIPKKPEISDTGEVASVTQMVQKYATSVHPDSAPTVASTTTKGEMLDAELDAAVWCWLNSVTLLLALKTGQLLVVQLKLDRDTVHDISITKSGGAPIASCLSVIGGDLLFIGSWQGDSLLVKFTPIETQEIMEDHAVMDATPSEELHDDDMLFFSGEKPKQSSMSQHQFTFSVIDSLLCIGPIRDIVSGAPPELESGTQHTSLSPQLVACVGSARSGSLAVLRNGIVAEVLIEVPVPDIEAVWALKYHDDTEHMSLAVTPYATDAYHVISTATGTMVLQSGEELEEVSDKSDFNIGARTIFAGSLFADTRLIQVCPETIRVLRGTELQQEITLESIVAELQPEEAAEATSTTEDTVMAETKPPPPDPASVPQTSNVFYDFGSLQEDSLPTDFLMDENPLPMLDAGKMDADPSSNALVFQSASICDPLLLLHLSDGRALILEGDKDSRKLSPLESAIPVLFAAPEGEISACCFFADNALWLSEDRPSAIYQTPIFCVVCRTVGTLEIYALPHMSCIFSFPAFPIGWKILGPNLPDVTNLNPFPKAVEIHMDFFSSDSSKRDSLISRPVLFALLDDGTLMIYSAFRPESGAMSFRKLEVECAGDAAWSQIRQHEKPLPSGRSRMVRFSDLGERHSCQGIFLCGMAPVFFIFSPKGLHMHRLLVDGSVSAMTPFSNVNCPKGFILSMTSDQLKICSLHNERLDCPWPCSKIPLRCTPNKLAWYPDGRLYLLLCSRPIPFRMRRPEEEGGDTHASAAYAVNEQAAREKGTEEGHEVRIIVPGKWSTVWHLPFQSNEVGMALRAVRLKNQAEEITQSFIAVGTATVLGEDYPSTGRILLLDIAKSANDEWEGKVVWSQECRAPVGIVAVLDGSLLMGIGNRLELCAWTGRDMTRLAFFDAPIFITSANVMKSFVLFGDFLKGIHFVWYTIPTSGHDTSAEAKEMVLLGKDFDQADVYSTEFLVNGSTLRFISADGGRNLHVHGYRRDHPDSWNGRKLVSEGSFHVGHSITKMLRMRLCSLDGTGRQAALYGSMEGSIGYIASVWDLALYTRLHMLQKLLTLHVHHVSGLNPIAFRQRSTRPGRASMCGFFKQGRTAPDTGVILDVELIFRFLHLDRVEQESLAQRCGTYRHQLVDDLQQIALMTSFF